MKGLSSKIIGLGLVATLLFPSCSKKYYADINNDDIKEAITYEKNSNGDYNIIANIAKSEGIEQEILKTIGFKPEDLDFSYINNDKKIDMVVGRNIPNTDIYELLASRGKGNNNFGKFIVLKHFEKKPDEVYITNMKKNNLSDIVKGEETQKGEYILSLSKNNGNGIYGGFKKIKEFEENPEHISIAYIDEDDNKDIVIGENEGLDYKILFLKNDGKNKFSKAILIKKFDEIPDGIGITDIDWDGDQDIILEVGGTFTGKIEGVKYKVLLNDGKGNFKDARNLFTLGDTINY